MPDKKKKFVVKFRHLYDLEEEIEVEADSEGEAYYLAGELSDEDPTGKNLMHFDVTMEDIYELETEDE